MEGTPPFTKGAPPSVLYNESAIGEQQSETSLAHHPPASDQLYQRQSDIINQRLGASAAQIAQAEHMVKRSRVDLIAGKIGDNVAVLIPLVDQGRGDPRIIFGVIVSCDSNMSNRIDTKSGALKGRYSLLGLTCVLKLL